MATNDRPHADYFLKIDGIDGESQDSKHPNEIQVADFKLNVANRGRRGDYKVGKAVHNDAWFQAYVDQSYPKFKKGMLNGDRPATAVLSCRKAGKLQYDYLRVTLFDVELLSCTLNTSGSVSPLVEFTLGFAKKQVDYKEQKQDGSLSGAITAIADLHGKRSGS